MALHSKHTMPSMTNTVQMSFAKGEEAEVVVKVEGEESRKSLIETLGKQVSSFFAPVVGVFSQESKEDKITVTEGSQDRAVNAGAPARGNDQ